MWPRGLQDYGDHVAVTGRGGETVDLGTIVLEDWTTHGAIQ